MRLTYCSVKSPQPRILCFSETSDKDSSSGRQISISSFNVRKADSSIVFLGTLSGGESDSSYHRLLAVHENGDIKCYSGDLETQTWEVDAVGRTTKEGISQKEQVEHGIVLSLEHAKKSVLKDREDILASLDRSTENMDSHVLLLFTRFTNENAMLNLRVSAIKTNRATSEDAVISRLDKPMQELLSVAIPEPDTIKRKSSTLDLHGASGTLYQYSPKHVAVYDLTGLVARLSHHTSLGQSKIATCLRISPYFIAMNTASSISVIDMQHRSLQAECSLQLQEKHKNQASDATSTRLLSFFAPLDLIIALQGRRLIGIPLSTVVMQEDRSRKRKRDGLLVNSIGRGIRSMHERANKHKPSHNIPKALGILLPSTNTIKNWSKQENVLNQYFAKGEFDKFETLMISELDIKSREDTSNLANKLENSTCDEFKIHYLLSKIFSPDVKPSPLESNDTSRKLRIRFFPASIVPYMLRKGLLSVDQIETSLKHDGALPLTDRIAAGALIHALAEWDPSLNTLTSLLESSIPLTAQELAHALQISLDFAQTAGSTEDTKRVTNDEPVSEIGSMRLTNGHASADSSSTPSKLENASAAYQSLQQTLARLSFHSTQDITRSLRNLQPSSLLHLIDHLRMSLARAGWLTPYTESLPSLSPDLSDQNIQILTISKLLNCLLDAIGSAGWLLSSSIGEKISESADTIAYMKAEISAALEGVEEATYLRGMLGEILLYASSYSTSQTKREGEKAGQGQRTITTIPPADENRGLANALPLGLKASQGVGMTKVGAGGELIRRSKRDVGRLKDREVPPYSFERIVV